MKLRNFFFFFLFIINSCLAVLTLRFKDGQLDEDFFFQTPFSKKKYKLVFSSPMRKMLGVYPWDKGERERERE